MELKRRQQFMLASILVAGLGMSPAAFADQHFHGVITQHADDGTLTVIADDSSNVLVLVTDSTKVRQNSKRVSAASLIPGLRIEVTGNYSATNQFVAERVLFSKSDIKTARAIRGGLGPTDARVTANEAAITQGAQILKQQGMALQKHGQQIAENEQKIVATSGIAESARARISNLDNFNVLGTMTVYFANGKAKIPAKYKNQLEEFAAQAKDTNAYLLQVQGYASAVGPDSLNQRLSSERAEAVSRALQQAGIPPTNITAPAGMATTNPVASNKTASGQAENRRAVVTLMQNKGIAGK